MKLDDLADFILVATNGGFAQASRASGRPKASLSRKVMDLEAALGVRLFERGARTIRLSAEGAALLERAGGPLREMTEAADFLRERRNQPHGLLRISAPNLLGQLAMGRIAAEFTMANPDVHVSITLEDREVDLVNEGYDLVIRVNPEPNSDLVGRCFARDQVLIVSTPDLKSHFLDACTQPNYRLPVIVRGSSGNANSWRVVGGVMAEIPIRNVLQLSHLTMIRDAAITGIGAARLPRLLIDDDLGAGRLVSWGGASDQQTELWVLHTSKRLPSAKVKSFIAYLETRFQKG